jgi:hypothetical protein
MEALRTTMVLSEQQRVVGAERDLHAGPEQPA